MTHEATAASTPKKKIAVILIHGIGEQRPMETIRSFVAAAWSQDGEVHGKRDAQIWSKPDDISESFELRRLTTDFSKAGERVDFFEYYWAHLMSGTELIDVGDWILGLISRSPWS